MRETLLFENNSVFFFLLKILSFFLSMSTITTTLHKTDDQNCRFIKSIIEKKTKTKTDLSLSYLDTPLDLITTTLSPFLADNCENQTQTPLDEIEDRINVVVPYLVVLGM